MTLLNGVSLLYQCILTDMKTNSSQKIGAAVIAIFLYSVSLVNYGSRFCPF